MQIDLTVKLLVHWFDLNCSVYFIILFSLTCFNYAFEPQSSRLAIRIGRHGKSKGQTSLHNGQNKNWPGGHGVGGREPSVRSDMKKLLSNEVQRCRFPACICGDDFSRMNILIFAQLMVDTHTEASNVQKNILQVFFFLQLQHAALTSI